MNYGVDNKYVTFTEDDLMSFDYLGIRYERDADKTYLISYDNKIIGIIDNTATYEQLESVIDSSFYTTQIADYSPDAQKALGDFVKSIERETGRTVDYAGLDGDGYTLVVDGETITFPYKDNHSLDMGEVLSKVSKRTTFQASDKLNEENKVVIENYLKEAIDPNSNVEVKLNEEGTYSIYIDGQEYIKLEKDITLAETVKSISDEIDSGHSLSDYNKRPETYRLQARTNQNYKVHIDENLFGDVLAKHNKVKNEIGDVKTLYRTDMMTDELLSSYNEVVGTEGNTNPCDRIDKTAELLGNITLNVKYSLEAYKNIDHNLGVVFNSIVNDIFKINSYHEAGEIKDYKSQTFEERETTLENLLNEYKAALDELKGELNKLYPSYYGNDRCTGELPPETYAILDTLMTCFVDGSGGFDLNNNFLISQFKQFVDFSKENDLMTKLDSYFGGDSWRKSGMAELNAILCKNLLDGGYDIDSLYNNYDYIGSNSYLKDLERRNLVELVEIDGHKIYRMVDESNGENILGRENKAYGYKDGYYYFYDDNDLQKYLLDRNIDARCEEAFLNQFHYSNEYTINNLRNVSPSFGANLSGLWDMSSLVNDKPIDEESRLFLKNTMGEWYHKGINYQERNSDEEKSYNLSDYCEMRVNECSSIITDIALVNESVYQYEQLQLLLPYEIEMENLDYFDYLVKDYSHIEFDENVNQNNISYLSQEELALYYYFKNSDSNKASGYIKALQDTINQRKGYEEAAMRIYEANKNGEDVIDILTLKKYGLSDGVGNFINGLGDFFTGIDKCFGLGIINDDTYGKVRTSDDYRNMYMLSLLQQDNVYNDQLSSAFRDMLQFEYKANTSIGNMAIPTLVSFIPVAGKVLSPVLLGMSSAGGTMRQTMLEGYGNTEALIYGLASGASEVLLERLLGGITGLNGNTEALQGFKAFLHSMIDEAGEEFVQAYFDGMMRSIILKEPFDLSSVSGDAFESALMALYTSGVMNCATNCAIKIADEVIYWSPSQFNNFSEFNNFVNNKIADRQSLIDISPETAAKMGINLREGETLKYNPNNNTYQKVNKYGYRFNIPNNLINEYEGEVLLEGLNMTKEEYQEILASIGANSLNVNFMFNYELEIPNFQLDADTINENSLLRLIANIRNSKIDLANVSSELLQLLNQKIINDQNCFVAFSNSSENNQEYISNYLANNPKLFDSFSTENLVRLSCGLSKDNFIKIADILSTRISNGENIDFSSITHKYFFGQTNDIESFYKKLLKYSPDLYNQVTIENDNRYNNNVPSEVKAFLDGSDLLSSTKGIIASLFENGLIDQRGIKILEAFSDNNTMLNSFDYKMLDPSIIDDFGVDFVTDIGRYSDLTTRLLSIKNNNPNVYDTLKNIILDANSDNSLKTATLTIRNSIKFLYNNANVLENCIGMYNIDMIEQYVYMLNTFGTENMVDFSSDFLEVISQRNQGKLKELVNRVNNGRYVSITDMKSAFFAEYFNLNYDRDLARNMGNNLIDAYGTNIDYLKSHLSNPENMRYIEMFEMIREISSVEDVNVLAKLLNSENVVRFTYEEVSAMKEALREEYVNTYLSSFAHTNEVISSNSRTVMVGGKEVVVVDYDGDFAFFVHSSDTGFTEDKVLINGSFRDTYHYTSDAAVHGVSTSFITQDNIGSAPVGKNGVLYGFTTMNNNDVQLMGTTDINSHIADYGFESGKQQFVTADEMSGETNRIYNEVALNRDTVEPSCIVLYSDASPEVVANSYAAASEWGIPVVRIDVDHLAQTQVGNIQGNLDNYRSTRNIDSLDAALRTYEAGVSGFNLNATEADTKFANPHDSVSHYYDQLDLEGQLLDIIDDLKKNGTQEEIDQFIIRINEINERYSRQNSTRSPISKTESLIDYKIIEELLKDE